MFKCYVSAHTSHVQIRNKCVTFAYSCTHMSHILHMRTTVRICTVFIFHDTAHIRAYSRFPLSEQRIKSVKVYQ